MDRARSTAVGLIGATLVLLAPAAMADMDRAVNLDPGQAKQVWIGPSSALTRVCNDATSEGTVKVAIGIQDSRSLAPGLCTESMGGSLALNNDRKGPALIVYHRTLSNVP